jgi:hypothetical protein
MSGRLELSAGGRFRRRQALNEAEKETSGLMIPVTLKEDEKPYACFSLQIT